MYSIAAYGSMLADDGRLAAYSAALRRAIRPESVALDLGCGAGIMTVLACRLGARRVYAIEPDDVIQVAREIARANGCEERIVFIQDVSTRATLPEPVDVIFSDLRGVLPLYQRHIPSVADARRRFLAPGGVLIPKQDTVWAVPVEAPQVFQRMRAGWETNGHGLDLKAGLRYAANAWRKERVAREQFLAEPQRWA
ncbi:MAG: 50S ribosomal protein L11 methyltransferase, partial [Terriglobales bacterium]